jgi:hypothetical protein
MIQKLFSAELKPTKVWIWLKRHMEMLERFVHVVFLKCKYKSLYYMSDIEEIFLFRCIALTLTTNQFNLSWYGFTKELVKRY